MIDGYMKVAGHIPADLRFSKKELQENDKAVEIMVLEDLLNWLDQPYPVCCGKGSHHGCCGEPEPAYNTPDELVQRMRERLAELSQE